MESQQSRAWFGIAQKVDALLALPGARERFQERVKEAAAESLRRSDLKRQREEARIEALKRTGVPYRAGRLPADPKDGSFYELQDLHDGGPDLEAWLPADLSRDLDPDDSPPLPVRDKPEVSLAERYAVLAAVWDVHWKGDRKLNPWFEDENCPEAIWYWSLLRADDPRLSGARLTNEDAAIVQTWIDDVEADLASSTSAKGNQDGTDDRKAGARGKRKRKRKPGPRGPQYDANEDKRIFDGGKASGEKSIDDYARKEQAARTAREIRKIRLTIDRERKRRERKGQK